MRHIPTTPAEERFKNFKKALEDRGVEVTYSGDDGKVVIKIQRGTLIHDVTEQNLIDFRSLTRTERRSISAKNRRHA